MGKNSLRPEAAAEGEAKPLASAPSERAIDLDHLSRQTLGDRALERDVLTLFERQARQVLAQLAQPPREAENKWRGGLAHTLKGSARAIGAFEVARAAERYEEAVNGRPNEIVARFLQVARAVDEARAAIAALLERA